MKAAVLSKLNSPLDILELPSRPSVTRQGQVTVRVICSGICGAQLQEIDGHKGNPRCIPHLLGHEGCAIVEEIGEGVKHVKPGDKVVIHWRKGDGCDAPGAFYYTDQPSMIGSGPATCFSEYSIVSENRVTRIDDDVPDDLACLLGCCLSTALGVIENEAKVKFGESVLIIGCGGVGLALILASKLANAWPIVVVDIWDKKDIAESLGAQFCSPAGQPYKDFDVVIDTTGDQVAINNGAAELGPSGRMILVGQPKGSLSFNAAKHLFDGDGKTIKATQGGCFSPSKDIPRYVNLWRSGALDDYTKLITHRISLDEINDGIDLIRQGKSGRVLIEMGQKSYKSPFSKEILKAAVQSMEGLEGPIFEGIGV